MIFEQLDSHLQVGKVGSKLHTVPQDKYQMDPNFFLFVCFLKKKKNKKNQCTVKTLENSIGECFPYFGWETFLKIAQNPEAKKEKNLNLPLRFLQQFFFSKKL